MLTVDANVWVDAFDPTGARHGDSIAFLQLVARRRVLLVAPVIMPLEVACAVARRARNPDAGRRAAEWLRQYPYLSLRAVDAGLLTAATAIGLERGLRGADALYAATADVHGAPLVSWDRDLVDRAGAATPADWSGGRRATAPGEELEG